MAELRLRCRFKQGQQNLTGIFEDSTLSALQHRIEETFGVPCSGQVIRFGYPPKSVDVSNPSATMKSLNITSGNTLIVEGPSSIPENPLVPQKSSVKSQAVVEAGIRRREVPADNHCLFYSIYFLMNEGEINKKQAQQLRARISEHILQNQDELNELVLGKSPSDYSAWIQSDNSWGGSIELSIFSTLFRVEIDAVDIMSSRIDRYNEGKYSQKVYLLYDGIHYDPLYWDSGVSGIPKQTVFQSSETVAEQHAIEFAKVLKVARQFTDTSKYKIRCGNCGSHFQGDKEIAEHANKTGHFNFQEI